MFWRTSDDSSKMPFRVATSTQLRLHISSAKVVRGLISSVYLNDDCVGLLRSFLTPDFGYVQVPIAQSFYRAFEFSILAGVPSLAGTGASKSSYALAFVLQLGLAPNV